MSAKFDPMLEAAKHSNEILEHTPLDTWAAVFVALRMDFFQNYARGLVCSTSHGLDYFSNVIKTIEGEKYTEKGELGDNFRKIISGRELPDAATWIIGET